MSPTQLAQLNNRGTPIQLTGPKEGWAPFSRKGAHGAELHQGKAAYATPRAFIGVLISTAGTLWLDCSTVRAATGFSQNKAKSAAIRSQAIIAQKTLVQEPVFSNIPAAPTP